MRRAQQNSLQSSGRPVVTTSQEEIERENDQLTKHLRGKVSELKHLSINIGAEIREQNSMLNQMHGDFDKSETVLKASMAQLLHISKTVWSSNKLLFNLLLFALFVFFIVWLLYR